MSHEVLLRLEILVKVDLRSPLQLLQYGFIFCYNIHLRLKTLIDIGRVLKHKNYKRDQHDAIKGGHNHKRFFDVNYPKDPQSNNH